MRSRIAVLNVGSSTVKVAEMDVDLNVCHELKRTEHTFRDHSHLREAIYAALDGLTMAPDALGHRVVHGGTSFSQPILITAAARSKLEKLTSLAPLHMSAALSGIDEATKRYPEIPAVAVFDTAFHSERRPESSTYALPHDLVSRFALRRYGFHGLAHESLVKAAATAGGVRPQDYSCVTLQLGAGCSACAVRLGRSIETSMGFSPLDGLVMMTRCGTVDAAIVLELVRAGECLEKIDTDLQARSGVFGICGMSDMRDVLAAARAGDTRAQLAVALFCRSIVLTVGGYFTLLGGAVPLVFGGGIGSNSPEIRARVVSALSAWGMELDPEANRDDARGRISSEESVPVYALDTNEEGVIALHVFKHLQ